MHEVLLSYMVPSFNHSKFIVFLLDSILDDSSQLSGSWELVIIDDGSSDDSVNVINKWIEVRGVGLNVKFYHRENRGLTATFNELIDRSIGKYVRVCGSDDILVPGGSGSMLAGFDDTDIVCVASDGTVIDNEGAQIAESCVSYHKGRPEALRNEASCHRELIIRWCLAGPSMIVSRRFYDLHRYDESITIDDYHLILSIIAHGKRVRFVGGMAYKYRIHGENVSKTRDKAKRIRNLKSMVCILNNSPLGSQYRHPVNYVRHLTMAKIRFLERSYLKAFANVLCAGCFYVLSVDD